MVDDFSGIKVLVTGANGFLGRHLLHRLRNHNAMIYAVSRTIPRDRTGAQWLKGDLTNASFVDELIVSIKPDIIYHLASASQGGPESQFVLPTFENDLRSTVNLLLAAKARGCSRIILVASLEEPLHDGSPIKVASPYAVAKVASTYYGIMFHQLYGVPVTMLRLFMTYGPGQKVHKLIPYTILSFLKGESPRISSGVRPVDWVYVMDVMTAFTTAAFKSDAVGSVIDLGSGCLVTVREVVEQIHRLIPSAPTPLLGARPDRAIENVRRADIEPSIRLLDWRATTPLCVGLSQTIEFYQRQGQTVSADGDSDFRGLVSDTGGSLLSV